MLSDVRENLNKIVKGFPDDYDIFSPSFELMQEILAPEHLQIFFAWALENITADHIQQVNNIPPYQFPLKPDSMANNFSFAKNIESIGQTGLIHPLLWKEYKSSLPALKEMHMMQRALRMVEDVLAAYIDFLYHHLTAGKESIPTLYASLGLIGSVLKAESFMEEFLPLFVHFNRAELEACPNPGELEGTQISKTMQGAFKRNAFGNTKLDEGGIRITVTCPLKKTLVPLFSSGVGLDENGDVRLVPKQSQASLPNFLMALLQNGRDTLSPKHLPLIPD